MDERVDCNWRAKTVGHQSFWSYEYNDIIAASQFSFEFNSYLFPQNELSDFPFCLLEIESSSIYNLPRHIFETGDIDEVEPKYIGEITIPPHFDGKVFYGYILPHNYEHIPAEFKPNRREFYAYILPHSKPLNPYCEGYYVYIIPLRSLSHFKQNGFHAYVVPYFSEINNRVEFNYFVDCLIPESFEEHLSKIHRV